MVLLMKVHVYVMHLLIEQVEWGSQVQLLLLNLNLKHFFN